MPWLSVEGFRTISDRSEFVATSREEILVELLVIQTDARGPSYSGCPNNSIKRFAPLQNAAP